MHPNVFILDGSLGGERGNTWAACRALLDELQPRAAVKWRHLAAGFEMEELLPTVDEADALVFCTGTYWDSWGSPLQRFLEEATPWEGSSLWLGKPAAVLVTMHSVGGKAVLSRLQGVLVSLGMSLPPMSGMVYSAVGHLARAADADLWSLEDSRLIARNLVRAAGERRSDWEVWPVDEGDGRREWLER